MPLWLIVVLVGAAIVALLSLWRRKEPVTAMTELVTGIIKELPAEEAARKSVDIDCLSLARSMQSEESGEQARLAVGYAVKRHAARKGMSITKLVTFPSHFPEVNGHYSQQRYAKYCSTFQTPTTHTLELAQSVQAGEADDPSQGAEQWDNPILQHALAFAHPYDPETHHGYKTPDEIAADREAAGYKPVAVEGTTTRFWVKAT